MEMWALLVDWDETKKRSEAGSLESDLATAIDDNVPWASDPDFQCSLHFYFAIGRAYDAALPHVSDSSRSSLSNSFTKFAKEEAEPWFETPNPLDTENHFLALAPDTVKELLENMKAVNYDELRALFSEHAPSDVKESFDGDSETFVQGLLMWQNLFEKAARDSKGLVVKVG